MNGSDYTTKVHCIAWVVLSAARDLYSATQYLGGTAVTAPPFFDTAARSDALFWHPDPKYESGSPADSPLVMALATSRTKILKRSMHPAFNEGRTGSFSPLPYQTVPRKRPSSSGMDIGWR